MSEARRTPFNNPGWAGNTGEFDLTEAQVRGDDYVGKRPPEGGHPSGSLDLPLHARREGSRTPLSSRGRIKERFEKIRSRYPDARSALLPALGMAQELRGHLSPETMDQVAKLLDLSPAYVRGVATFYTMYNKRPVGRFLIQVCTNISCGICGGDDVLQAFLNNTGTELGETSEDGNFTVIEAECLAGMRFPDHGPDQLSLLRERDAQGCSGDSGTPQGPG